MWHVCFPSARIDSILLILLGIAAVPWLSAILESIETPFGGIKYRSLAGRLDQLEGESSSVRQVQDANDARERARVLGASLASPSEALEALAAKYNTVRAPGTGMKSGAARTQVMTRIVGQMIAAADDGGQLPLEPALSGDDLGRRLAAYAVLYSRPDPRYAVPLVDSVLSFEPKPFGQFWGLRAIARLVEDAGPDSIDLNTVRRLRAFEGELPAASDRAFELRRVLAVLPSP